LRLRAAELVQICQGCRSEGGTMSSELHVVEGNAASAVCKDLGNHWNDGPPPELVARRHCIVLHDGRVEGSQGEAAASYVPHAESETSIH